MRVLCLIPQLGAGGAERVIVEIANFLVQRHVVQLLTWEAVATRAFFWPASAVEVIKAGRSGGRGPARWIRLAFRVPTLRRRVQDFKPDVVLSFLTTANITAVVACAGLRVPIVVSERNDPAKADSRSWVSLARRLTYPRAARTVVQTDRIARHFRRTLQSRMVVLPNPIPSARRRASPMTPGPGGRFRIVAVGRLEHQKGIDRLIAAFVPLAAMYPAWDVVVFGDGSKRDALTRQVEASGLAGRVSLAGVTEGIDRALAAAHLFAFPSRFEGFPNALGEAMAAGLPSVGYAGVSGVEELIVDGLNGLLLPHHAGVPSLTTALDRLMGDAELRMRMGAAAVVHVQRWSPERVLAEWERLLVDVATNAS